MPSSGHFTVYCMLHVMFHISSRLSLQDKTFATKFIFVDVGHNHLQDRRDDESPGRSQGMLAYGPPQNAYFLSSFRPISLSPFWQIWARALRYAPIVVTASIVLASCISTSLSRLRVELI